MATYTEEELKYVKDEYKQDPSRSTVDRLSEELSKPIRSIIAKLSNAGIYKTPEKFSKTGEAITRKEDLADEIGEWFGIKVPSLSKAAKLELKALHSALANADAVRAHLVDLEYEE